MFNYCLYFPLIIFLRCRCGSWNSQWKSRWKSGRVRKKKIVTNYTTKFYRWIYYKIKLRIDIWVKNLWRVQIAKELLTKTILSMQLCVYDVNITLFCNFTLNCCQPIIISLFYCFFVMRFGNVQNAECHLFLSLKCNIVNFSAHDSE